MIKNIGLNVTTPENLINELMKRYEIRTRLRYFTHIPGSILRLSPHGSAITAYSGRVLFCPRKSYLCYE